MTIRLGGVPYGVGAPLVAGLDQDPDIEFLPIAPAKMVPQLRDGSLAAALVSSIEAFRHPGYRVAPRLCIASRGPARSVRAFQKPDRPVQRVGLDSGSESSVALLKILLSGTNNLDEIAFERIEPTTTPAELPHDLVMLIGDAGLAADPGDRRVLDLGSAWHERTGLPFVYALWLLHRDADAEQILPPLMAARRRALEQQVDDGTEGSIYYDLGPHERQGLARFHIEAAELGLADPTIEPEFLTDHEESN